MYKSDEELFHEVMQESGAAAHPRYMEISACVSTMVSLRVGTLDGMTHEQVLLLAAKFGFRFADHADARLVVQLVDRWHDKRHELDLENRKAPFHAYDAHFFRDPGGRLMATFSMGATTFRPVELSESWERKFASVYQDTLVQALKLGVEHGVHDAEDRDGDEPER